MKKIYIVKNMKIGIRMEIGMMDYELFKEVIIEKFESFLSDRFQDYKIKVKEELKVNRTVDAINLIPKNVEGVVKMATFYINDLYKDYLAGEDLQNIIQTTVDAMANSFEKNETLDISTIKHNIIVTLVNTEQNKQLLQNVPNRKFQDLSIVYRWVVAQDKDGISSTIIGNLFAEKMGLNEEMLYNIAMKNTAILFPPVIENMKDVITKMMLKDGILQELIDIMVEEVPDEMEMYIITNSAGIQGASAMLFEDKIHKLAEKMNTDLYILPSSIHESIAVSTKMCNPNDLAELVNEINMREVSIEERLSNQVYFYDRDSRKISLATDTPNKCLDEEDIQQEIYNKKEYSR